MAKPDLDTSYIRTIFLKKKQVWVTFTAMAVQKPVPIILCELYTYYIRNIQFFCLKKSKRYYVHKEHFIKKKQIRYISGELHKEYGMQFDFLVFQVGQKPFFKMCKKRKWEKSFSKFTGAVVKALINTQFPI